MYRLDIVWMVFPLPQLLLSRPDMMSMLDQRASDLRARLALVADRLDSYVCVLEASQDSRAVFTFAYVKITRTLCVFRGNRSGLRREADQRSG